MLFHISFVRAFSTTWRDNQEKNGRGRLTQDKCANLSPFRSYKPSYFRLLHEKIGLSSLGDSLWIIRCGGDARRLIYYGHQCHLAANASRPPSIPPPLLLLLPMPTSISSLRLRRNSSLKSSTLDPPLHSPHMRRQQHQQRRRWRGRRAGSAAAERLATLAGDRPPPCLSTAVRRGWWTDADDVDYLSMLATGNRGSLSGPVDVLLPHIGRIIRLTGFSLNQNDAF